RSPWPRASAAALAALAASAMRFFARPVRPFALSASLSTAAAAPAISSCFSAAGSGLPLAGFSGGASPPPPLGVSALPPAPVGRDRPCDLVLLAGKSIQLFRNLGQRVGFLVLAAEFLTLQPVERPGLGPYRSRLLRQADLDRIPRLHQIAEGVALLTDGGGELRPVERVDGRKHRLLRLTEDGRPVDAEAGQEVGQVMRLLGQLVL